MNLTTYHYFPLAAPFLLLLGLLVLVALVLIEVGVLRYAYARIGIPRGAIFALLLLSLLGSYVNIPVAQLPAEQVLSGQVVTYFGVPYVIPVVEQVPGTIVAINVGGALVTLLVSIYLVVKNRIYGRAFLGVVAVAAVDYFLAQPVPGVGIALPLFVPLLVSTAVALLLLPRAAPAMAYVSGNLGTLIGADLLNLGKVEGLGAPIASIGGAGTFDGIFLTGVLAGIFGRIVDRLHHRRPDSPQPEPGSPASS